MLAQVKDDHGHLPKEVVYRVHSDKGSEFVNNDLQTWCNEKGIHMTHTAGYDPSANGAGESAIGFLKRKCRHLLTGNRLTTRWWGVGVLAAAYYSRCAAGLEMAGVTIWYASNGCARP